MLEFIGMVAIVVGLPALLFWALRVISPELARGECPEHWRFAWRPWHAGALVAVAVLVAVVLASHHEPNAFLVLVPLVVIALFLRAWRYELLFLMGRRDDEFPGRHDKAIWAVALLAFAPVGVWFFRSYRLAHWPESHFEPGRAKPRATPDFS
jgi:hypothetical protein